MRERNAGQVRGPLCSSRSPVRWIPFVLPRLTPSAGLRSETRGERAEQRRCRGGAAGDRRTARWVASRLCPMRSTSRTVSSIPHFAAQTNVGSQGHRTVLERRSMMMWDRRSVGRPRADGLPRALSSSAMTTSLGNAAGQHRLFDLVFASRGGRVSDGAPIDSATTRWHTRPTAPSRASARRVSPCHGPRGLIAARHATARGVATPWDEQGSARRADLGDRALLLLSASVRADPRRANLRGERRTPSADVSRT